MNKSEIKHILRNSPFTSKTYRRIVDNVKGNNFSINSLKVPVSITSEKTISRLNLVLPAFEKDFVYGGITTTINILKKLCHNLGYDSRIIVLNGCYSEKSSYKVEGYNNQGDDPSLLFLNDCNNNILIRKNDLFIATMWNTVYLIRQILNYQIEKFNLKSRKFIYLIQDYETGFYNWSTEYVMCDNTYKENSDDIIAIFNAESLYQYFINHEYNFFEEYFFNPSINGILKKQLEMDEGLAKREKVILLYGRPRVDRNAFELIRYSLEKWSEKYNKADDWKIYSLGAEFDNISLKNNIIECKGKLSIEEYAEIMKKSYAAISLMVSPHPSYPPLEFSTFGLRTITNQYENKNLDKFNSNIISLEFCSPENIINTLIRICDEYEKYNSKYDFNEEYYEGCSFDNTMDLVAESIKKMVLRDNL